MICKFQLNVFLSGVYRHPSVRTCSLREVCKSPLLCVTAEMEESQESSMTDADDTQLHTTESDEVL